MPRPRTSLLAPYRRVLGLPGAARFSLAGIVARMPYSMTGLGIVLLVEGITGEYAAGGATSAAYTLGGAAFVLLQGRLVDRLGQSRVLPVGALGYAAGLLLLTLTETHHWPHAWGYAFAALAGASMPPVGPSVRARWSHLLGRRDPELLGTAYAWESVADEVVFVTGPLLCTLLSTGVRPWAGLIAATVLCLIGTGLLAAQRGTEPQPHGRGSAHAARVPIPWRVVGPLALASLLLGVFFGAGEVTTVAFADEHGHKALAGIPLALWACGSGLAGIVVGAVRWRRGHRWRLRLFSLCLALSIVPLLVVNSLPLLCLLMLLAGLAISPTIVSVFSLVEEAVPPSRMTEGMALVSTGMTLGVAPGSWLSGVLIDASGARTAWSVPLGAGLLVALTALVALPSVASAPHSTTEE